MYTPTDVSGEVISTDLQRQQIFFALLAPLRRAMRKGELSTRVSFNFIRNTCGLDRSLHELEIIEIQRDLEDWGWTVKVEDGDKYSGEFIFDLSKVASYT